VKVLVTGGAGFLGRGILRAVSQGRLGWDVTVYSRDETKQDLCRRRYPFARYVLGDVRDAERMQFAMVGHDAVVHAAALKYIPEAELNAHECVAVNVHGSLGVIRAARAAQVPRVVGISTDKACQPVNTYGATKMLMERLFSEASGPTTAFTCVRYGNVVGSTGSVLPLFAEQYRETGRVRITDSRMTRFWMSVDEAIGLIETALSAEPNTIIVPMASAMSLVDAARAATSPDVPIDIIGERPGEKHHEMLIHYEESVRVTRREGWYELHPPGSALGGEAFTLASHSPNHRITIDEMRRMIDDAKDV